MPVKVTKENRSHLAGSAGIPGGAEDIAGLIWKLTIQAGQGKVDKAGGGNPGETILGKSGHGGEQQEEGNSHHINSIEVNFLRMTTSSQKSAVVRTALIKSVK